MDEKTINILNKLNDERYTYNSIKRSYVQVQKAKENGHNYRMNFNFNMHTRYGDDIKREHFTIQESTSDVMYKVLDILLEHYTQLGFESKKRIDDLVEELKNTPSDVAASNGAE